jgi:S1-C subfamily serine protease
VSIDQSPVPHHQALRRRRRLVPVGAVAAAAVLAAAGGVVAAAATGDGSSTTAVAAPLNPSTISPGDFSGYFGGARNRVPSQVPGTGSGGTGSSATVSATITDAVDPTLVDINTTLGLENAAAAGTGIVLTSTGEILTNNHVIDGATAITATDVGNGKTYTATVVGYDVRDDLAVLQLQGASGLATASIGDSSTLTAGATIAAIGNAGGVGGTPSAVGGTVTALDQSITASDEGGGNAEQLTGLIAVAADIQAGDSGGPLVDRAGHIVGIDTAGDGNGTGYAIPINTATAIAAQIVAQKASSTVHIGATAFIGVEVASSDSARAADGVAVAGVVAGSPAEQAGLIAGDTLLTLNGTALSASSSLSTLLGAYHPGDRVTFTVADGSGQTSTVTVTLTTGPAA